MATHVHVSLRVTAEIKASWQAAAQRGGDTLSGWLADLAARELERLAEEQAAAQTRASARERLWARRARSARIRQSGV